MESREKLISILTEIHNLDDFNELKYATDGSVEDCD